MRGRTVVAVAVVVAALAGVVVLGVGSSNGGGELTERWVSDTPRQNDRNHHAVGASEDGRVVVAPVAESPKPGLTDTSCTLARLATDDGAVQWRTTIDPERCFTHALTEPVVTDLDGDGQRTVVSATTENALVAYDADDGSEQWRAPLSTGEPSYGYGRPTVADLPVSPGREVVVSDIDGHVAAVTANGTVAWRASFADVGDDDVIVQSPPVVTDADADGEREVVVGSYDSLLVLTADGDVAWNRSTPAQHVATTQADDDAARELLVGNRERVTALDGATGETQWSTAFETSVQFVSAGVVESTDTVSVGTFTGDVVALDATTGEERWRTTVSGDGQPVWSPVVADLNGDGEREVVATSRDGTVSVLAADDGRVLATYERAVPIETFVTLADLDAGTNGTASDGDGPTPEVLVRYGDGRVVALDYTR
ncbi:PQQ-binding-like beta-propeller repeat protein [Halomarina rubra]|uniref:PQQ-binding-like beta-propeller repeat protein n=1 Tax=Halomarina rubra TaxID=2071873 RepID=A0ABD6B2J9_9EURY|nr:PQQ-binding-like beta-propeller repeat protein [Halomarina rubra]